MKRRWGERAERYLLEQSSLATNNNHRDLWASTAPGARARTCGTRCNECSSASLDSSGGSGGRKARFRSVREGEEGRRSDRGESAFGYRRGKEKSLGEGKASIAGFCESAFTRGAGAHLDVGGGLLLDLGNGLFDLNLKIGRGTGRLGRPSRASFLLVPAQQTRLVKTKSIPGGEDIALQNVPPGRAQPRLPRIAK